MADNERHDLPTLRAAPLNVSRAQVEEMQTAAYLLRMVQHDLPPGPAHERLSMLARAMEHESEFGKRLYKYARQRALDPVRLEQLRKGIVVVTNGEMRALGLDKT